MSSIFIIHIEGFQIIIGPSCVPDLATSTRIQNWETKTKLLAVTVLALLSTAHLRVGLEISREGDFFFFASLYCLNYFTRCVLLF